MPSRAYEEADPRILRAIAHPVRNRILVELGASKQLRAADVAQGVGIPANQASFHLRQLAKYGLVERAGDSDRDGRDRYWRQVHAEGIRLHLDDSEQPPAAKAALTVWARQASAQTHRLVDAAYGRKHPKGCHASISENALRLTKKEAEDFDEEFGDLVQRWRNRTGDEESAGRRTYHVLCFVQPYPDDPS